MQKKHRLRRIVAICTIAFAFSATLFSCSTYPLKSGNYFSVSPYIIESTHVDVWRDGHYLLTIDSLNRFELKEVSVKLGRYYSVCSGYLQRCGLNTYRLKTIKKEYPYGALGNPYHNDANYRITIVDYGWVIILKKGRWKACMEYILPCSIPKEFDFTKFGYY